MTARDDDLWPGERTAIRIDRESGRVDEAIDRDWLAFTAHAIRELIFDIRHRRFTTADMVLLWLLIFGVARGLGG
jgi:hypothetical protein